MSFVPAHSIVQAKGSQPVATGFLLHGILGSRRNWRTMARRMAQAVPAIRWVLVDHRNHGDSDGAPGPHTLAACADDLTRLAAQVGMPQVVVGHSFGGKVALTYGARQPESLCQVWALDTQPGAEPASDDNEVMQVIRALRALSMPVFERQDVVKHLSRLGFSPGLAQWMTTNLERVPEGFDWTFDLDGITEMIHDYFAQDCWPFLEDSGEVDVHVVRAERSDRWTPEVLARFADAPPRVHLHLLEDAGHWVHVDNPQGLLALMEGPLSDIAR